MSVDKELDEYTTRGSEVHVDSVRVAFLKMYGPGEFIHSDANEGAAKVFDSWVRFLKAEAWDEGHWEGWQNAREALLTDMFGGPTLNPYREETE